MRYIGQMAFANCKNLERLEFQARTKESGGAIEIESVSYGQQNGDELVINGAHNLQTGEILFLTAELGDNSVPRVEWSSSSEVLTINSSTGKVVANKPGRVKVTATLVDNRAVTAEVEIVITEIESEDCLKMYWDSFSRCPSLKEIYLHAYNPNTIVIDSGSGWLFNSTCKIYVPKGARDMYVNHTLWSKYADQIVEMQEDDAENTIDIALSAVNLTKEAAGDIYSAVNPDKIDNIIYLIQNGSNYELVNAYVGSVILNNASATVISSSTDKAQLFNLFGGLVKELSQSMTGEDMESKVLENHVLLALKKLDKIYEDYKKEDYSEENYNSLESIKAKVINNIKNASSTDDIDSKLVAGWKESYEVLKNDETEKPAKEFNLDEVVVEYDDIDEVKNINEAKIIAINEIKKSSSVTDDKIDIYEIDVVNNDSNPDANIYKVSYKLTKDSETIDANIFIYVKNGVATIVNEDYAGVYDLIKVVMASAKKVEK